MNTQQLIENAMLDALGLLSDDEQRAFERAFWAASPAVQAHVRREQTRLSRIESLLPKIDPPADLRAAVLQAVREAMVAQLAQQTDEANEHGPIPILSSFHVSPVWRAASLGFAAAAAVFGATTLFMWMRYDQINDQMHSNVFNDTLRTAAEANVSSMLFGTRKVNFVAMGAAGGSATLHYRAETGEAFLTVQDLDTGRGDYELRLTDATGAPTDDAPLATFQTDGALRTHKLTLSLPAGADGMRLALVSTRAPSQPLFVSEALLLS